MDSSRTRREEQRTGARLRRQRWTDACLAELPRLRGRRRGAIEDAIVRAHFDLVAGIARRVAPGYREQEDLRQVGCIGLVHAVRRYDPEVGDDFVAFAIPTVMGEIKHYLRDAGWFVKPPRRVQELAVRLDAASGELSQLHGRPADLAELARHLGATPLDVGEAMRARENLRPASLDVAAGGREEAEPGAIAGGEDDPGFERAEIRVTLRRAARNLPERERRILYLRFVEERTQREIAADVGVTQMQVSRLLKATLERMRHELEGGASAERRAGSARGGTAPVPQRAGRPVDLAPDTDALAA
ncbi:sigma-70 family RNA polymerase sigma factor [Agromyces sp. GXS1127]|uniref:sigma-70 family RNA polymerase sigma factor n=1 Tax=Agromyces sp. GXS1127 TaxID=3424181 RepID=UPI003D321334